LQQNDTKKKVKPSETVEGLICTGDQKALIILETYFVFFCFLGGGKMAIDLGGTADGWGGGPTQASAWDLKKRQ